MSANTLLTYLWKLPICGLAFVIGLTLGSMAATAIGLPMPAMPAGADPATLSMLTMLGSLLLAMALAWLAHGIASSFVARWLIIALLIWVAHGVNNALEAAIFTTMSAASAFTVVMYAPAAFLCAAAVAWLFPPDTRGRAFITQLRSFFASRQIRDWVWRLPLAFLAFPVVYYGFGSLIAPLVLEYYRQGVAELTVPGLDVLLPVLLLRSLLFLLVCLPVVVAWQASDWRLVMTLGLVLFMLVGGVNLLQAYWFPPILRVVHSLEILADEFVYAGALVVLLVRHMPQPLQHHTLHRV